MRQRTLHPTSLITGVRLKEIRESKKLSIREMANLTGVDFTFIKKIETGKADASILMINRFMNALGLDLRDFFDQRYMDLFYECIKEQECQNV